MLINHPVPYLAGFFVTLVAWADQLAAQADLEFLNNLPFILKLLHCFPHKNGNKTIKLAIWIVPFKQQ